MYPFNVRVYGVLNMKDSDTILVSEETIQDQRIVKFPGGGLQFGEGIIDALRREFLEELHLHVRVDNHLYTTDFFQASAFNPQEQLIAIYYWLSVEMSSADLQKYLDVSNAQTQKERQEFCYLLPKRQLSADLFHFPIDQYVVGRYLKD